MMQCDLDAIPRSHMSTMYGVDSRLQRVRQARTSISKQRAVTETTEEDIILLASAVVDAQNSVEDLSHRAAAGEADMRRYETGAIAVQVQLVKVAASRSGHVSDSRGRCSIGTRFCAHSMMNQIAQAMQSKQWQ
jgi:hypothetical protein